MKTELVILMAAGMLAGCSSSIRTSAPAPIEGPGGVQQATPESYQAPGGPAIAAYQAPKATTFAAPAPGKAVQVLMLRAQDQRQAKDYAGAVVSLERALRISPRNAPLWNHLAQVRLDQGNHQLATELASKSNALAHPERKQLRRENWLIIARAKRAMGDGAGARRAEQEANNS